MKKKLLLFATLLILAMNMSSCYVREPHGERHHHESEHHEEHHEEHHDRH